MKKVYYRSPGKSVCADVIPFYEDGEFKLFYLRDYRDRENDGEGCPWCLLTTKDLVNYVDHGPVLLRGKEDEQDLYVFTGSIFKISDKNYVIYYTGHNPHLRAQGFPEQKILRAFSTDLETWHKDKDFVFEAPEYLEMHDFRDPFVYYDEEREEYRMLIAARDKNDKPYFTKGVTLLATSKDLDKWELQKEPFYYPHAFFTHECPDLFKMGNWYYLIFSEFTDKISGTYRMSKTPYGPWIAPLNNTFDGHAFYAPKSWVDKNGRRILFGWNPIKNNEQDFDWWQWGGHVVPHQIIQNEDGSLGIRCPDEVRNAFDTPVALEDSFQVGNVEVNGKEYYLGKGEDGLNMHIFKQIPNCAKIEMKFIADDLRGDFGVYLRGANNFDRYYKIKFEPRYNRVAMDTCPRKDGNLVISADTERYIPIKPGEENTLLIIMQESVLEVYINEQVAMSYRMFDIPDGEFGVYSHNTSTRFIDIEVKE